MPFDRVQCVLVLYRTTLEASETFQTLTRVLSQYPVLASRLSLLVYDNSPEPHTISPPTGLFADIRYQHDGSNGGLAAAYNQALHFAEDAGLTWLWLFDQDTTVLPDYVPVMFAALDGTLSADVCAIVPKLVQDRVMLSPILIHRFRNVVIDERMAGVRTERLAALNSCACLRVSALRDISGFPEQYWLDFLDHIVFHRLRGRGGKLLVLDVTIPHRLSTNNLRKESSRRRYENLLAAEWLYVRETGWGGGSLLHRLRLIKRSANTLIRHHEFSFALLSLKWSLR